jgi:crossover junction endodeoxyribonuclease RuvC
MDEKYVVALDLSLSNSGVCIFDENENPVEIFSISTSQKQNTGERLKTIADSLININKKYEFETVVLEQGFARFFISTQMLFRVHGIANYVFYDKEQIYYAPSSIKKIVGGNGRADKKIIRKIVEDRFPYLKIEDEDQSDAVSIGMAYFIDKKEKKNNAKNNVS